MLDNDLKTEPAEQFGTKSVSRFHSKLLSLTNLILSYSSYNFFLVNSIHRLKR